MASLEEAEQAWVKGLCTNAEATDPSSDHFVQIHGGEVSGIALEGDLRSLGDVEGASEEAKDVAYGSPAEQGGGAAAEVDGLHRLSHQFIGSQADLGGERSQVVLEWVERGDGVEVAVGTLRLAEWDVDVDPCHRSDLYVLQAHQLIHDRIDGEAGGGVDVELLDDVAPVRGDGIG